MVMLQIVYHKKAKIRLTRKDIFSNWLRCLDDKLQTEEVLVLVLDCPLG